MTYPDDVVPAALLNLPDTWASSAHASPLRCAEAAVESLRDGRARGLAATLIAEVCADRELLRTCASRSEAHPLGFSQFLLLSTREFQVRLHVWRPGVSGVAHEDIHDHRFPFTSAVLTGNLLVRLYEFAADGEQKTHMVERLPEADGPHALQLLGRTSVACVGTYLLSVGTVYVTSADTLHNVTPAPEGLVATLLLKFPSVRPDTNVIMEPGAVRDFSAPRQRYSPESAGVALQEVLAAIT